MRRDNKELNFELDLLPFISMLSCCILVLLVTAVWSNLGTLNVDQAIGTEAIDSEKLKSASLWVTIASDGMVEVSLKDAPQMPSSFNKINIHPKRSGQVDFAQIDKLASRLNERLPELKTAVIMPRAEVAYGDVITIMDRLKKNKISDVGIAPL